MSFSLTNHPDERMKYQIIDNGDSGLTLIFEEPIGEPLTRKIVSLDRTIKATLADCLFDLIPSYQSLTLLFSPLKISKKNLIKKISKFLQEPIEPSNYHSKILEIPVCYEFEYAKDLSKLAKYCGMTVEQVIHLHSSSDYMVHMLGFLPGFLYLGGLPPQLYCPRKRNPELRVPAGSVAIGGSQTGVYPVESPAGWHVIGRTPITLFDPTKENPVIASPLDRVNFVSICKSDYVVLQQNMAH